jgi:D-beta-D-heptose 7-phosphate kinase/D-beta-D-heptose 1-phosphate adenosyltransferase
MVIEKFLKLHKSKKLKIYVIGDSLIDEYYNVNVNRISPEFPGIICQSDKETPAELRCGGAANVVYQYSYMNVDAYLFSITKFTTAFNQINTEYCIYNEKCNIPIKKRLMKDGIQVARWDIESPNYGQSDDAIATTRIKLLDKIKNAPLPDIVVLSDYDKGLFSDDFAQECINFYNNQNIKTIVDPKKGNIKRWKGCTIFKPNIQEAKNFISNYNTDKELCLKLKESTACRSIVITCSGNGLMGLDNDRFFTYTPKKKVQVESVIGAGDCAVSLLSVCIGLGMPLEEASEVAYEGGSLYVQSRLNKPIMPIDLNESKIIHPEELKKRNFKVIFANGCFDLGLSQSHCGLLKFAKSQIKDGKLIVALNSDESVRKLKGIGRPIMSFTERAEIIASLDCVDYVTQFEEDTPLEIIKTIKPDLIIKGGDYKIENVVGSEIAPVILFPYQKGTSTTDKIKKILELKT